MQTAIKRKAAQGNHEAAVELWNAHMPSGTPVIVTLDSGEKWETTTRSEAWVMGGHTAVVMLTGRSGAYLLSRVRAK